MTGGCSDGLAGGCGDGGGSGGDNAGSSELLNRAELGDDESECECDAGVSKNGSLGARARFGWTVVVGEGEDKGCDWARACMAGAW